MKIIFKKLWHDLLWIIGFRAKRKKKKFNLLCMLKKQK